MSVRLDFRQVDVFSAEPLLGNPVAVVHLEHLAPGDPAVPDDARMAAFARWTNLSETTFVLAPTDPRADYRLRIFTPTGELPFAGHPTLGSAHAWLEAGGRPAGERIMQECGVGLVELRRSSSGRLAFAAPPLIRSGPVDDDLAARIVAALGVADDDVLAMAWADNGPGWVGVLLAGAEQVLAVRPALADLPVDVGVVGAYPAGSECAVEVRAFVPHAAGVGEDPVTGSLNASLAQWLIGEGVLPPSYVAAQGTVLGRRGRVHVRTDEAGTHWIGGDTGTTVHGTVAF